MTTNIDLDRDLIEQAMQLSGHRTKRAAIHQALKNSYAGTSSKASSICSARSRTKPTTTTSGM